MVGYLGLFLFCDSHHFFQGDQPLELAKLALLGYEVEDVAGLVFGQCISASWLQRTRKTAVCCIVLSLKLFCSTTLPLLQHESWSYCP